jgi:transcription elongation factor Elf1
MENARFLSLLRSVVRWFRRPKGPLQTDKAYYYFKCPTCGQPMRVPRGLGKVQIRCRSCSSQFETRS